MFELDHAITKWRQEMFAIGITGSARLAELENHLREQFGELRSSGLTDAERFQIATGRLGEMPLLKQEFGKVDRERVWTCWRRLSGVDILGTWFVLSGLSTLSYLPYLWLAGFSTNVPQTVACIAFCGLQMVIGVGLLRRWKFSLYSALAWGALYLIVCVCSLRPFGGAINHLIFFGFHAPAEVAHQVQDLNYWQLVFFFTRFADFRHVTDFLNPLMLIWAGYLLTRKAVRETFRGLQAGKTV